MYELVGWGESECGVGYHSWVDYGGRGEEDDDDVDDYIRKLEKSRFSHMTFTNPLQHYTALTTAHNLLDARCRMTMVLSVEYNIASVMCND